MAWDADKPAADDAASSMMTGVLANWSAIQTVLTSTRLDNFTAIPDFFPEGTISWFYADSAPDGWTLFADASDELLAVKSGVEDDIYEFGGVQAGTWQQPDHTLTDDELPSHTHSITPGGTVIIRRGAANTVCWRASSGGTKTLTSVGGGEAHNHGSDWRPAARVGILCSIDDPAA